MFDILSRTNSIDIVQLFIIGFVDIIDIIDESIDEERSFPWTLFGKFDY